jgi:hypothetical protein
MPSSLKPSTAAFLNAVLAVLTLIVAFFLIGPAVMQDPGLFVQMALNNPAPLYIQDGLKFISIGVAFILVGALHSRLVSDNPALMKIASGSGIFATILLLLNAVLSLITTSQAASFANNPDAGLQLNALVGLLGLASIFFNGPWYLGLSWTGLKGGKLPKGLSYLGLVMGALSLLPFLGILVLLLSIFWSIWLGRLLRPG